MSQSGQQDGSFAGPHAHCCFKQIVRDLRSKRSGTTLERVLEWITAMHGYLSSSTGGGVRHGIDLCRGVAHNPNEARLFCNLTRSYICFSFVDMKPLSTRMHNILEVRGIS